MSSRDARGDDYPKMPWVQKLSYGVGHVLNDLCASMWFTYLLIYLHSVIDFSNSMAGNLLLLGQVSDALCTPFIGYESDRTKGIRNYGKRKTWHLIGSICVALTFPFLFNECITCSKAADWAKFLYYAPFVVIFQFGWASTQISHLSLIPSLTPNEHDRVELNAIRYSFTVISNLVVFGLTWLLLDLKSGKTSESLSEKDAPHFRDLVFIVVGIGIVFSAIFHIGTREVSASSNGDDTLAGCASQSYVLKSQDQIMLWRDWFKEPQFYLVGLIYMCTRLVVNVSQVYLPMYLEDALQLHKDFIAIIPLVVYISGFVTTFVMKIVNKKIGRKLTYLIGLLFIFGACVWMWFIAMDKLGYEVIGSAICLGVGGSTILVTSLSMTADLIACSIESSAFVYGAMSFTDKLSNGVAIFVIQQLHPCRNCCTFCSYFYRDVIVLVPGGVAAVAVIALIVLAPQQLGVRRGSREKKKLQTFLPDSDGSINYQRPLLGDDPPSSVTGYGSVQNQEMPQCSDAAHNENDGVDGSRPLTVCADIHRVKT